jgi:predicted MFS family arabinose efflux permease
VEQRLDRPAVRNSVALTTTTGPTTGDATKDARPERSTGPVGPRRTSIFSALATPYFPSLLLTGALWNVSRWGLSFLGAYLAIQLSGSPRLVQLTGVAMWGPLLVGGVAGGVIADRFNRRRTVFIQLCVLIPLTALMGLLFLADRLRLWMVYPFLAVVGVGWVVDMTCRRAMVSEVVCPHLLANAMALESVSLAAGLALGTLIGGAAIEAIGVGNAFLCVAALLTGSLVAFTRVPHDVGSRPPAPGDPGQSPTSSFNAVVQGFGLLARYPSLLSVLGVTAFVNFFYFSFTPLVQVFGRQLGVGPALVGVLASMIGVGMMIGSLSVARFLPRRRGLAYVSGAFAAMLILVPFTRSGWYPLSTVLLLGASVGMGFFGSTQATLVMTVAPEEVRGRALGLLSTAIGVLPLGMIALGELAEAFGAPTAVLSFTLTGTGLMLLWLRIRPEVLHITA